MGIERSSQLSLYNRDEWLLLEELPFHKNITQLLCRFRFKPPLKFLTAIVDQSILDVVAPVNPRSQKQEVLESNFLVLEHFPGSLRKYLTLRLGVEQLLRVCKDVGKAIEFLFKHQVVHRDLRLDNVLVSHAGVAALCDFGLALKLPENMTANLFPHDALGGLGRIAPEVSKARIENNIRQVCYLYQPSWELGVLFFEIAFGESPFDNSATVYAVPDVQTKARALQQASGLIYPAEFLDMVQQCLAEEGPSRPTLEQIMAILRTCTPPRTALVPVGASWAANQPPRTKSTPTKPTTPRRLFGLF